MLDRFDDYPIHQTPEPVAHPASADRNHYDRYFFHGYSREGDLFFGAALGLYPNRRVLDASFSVVRDGRQHSLHASRLAPRARGDTRVGPIAVAVDEPMRRLRLRVEPNAFGLACDLRFFARSEAVEEPRTVRHHEGRVFMDSTRFTQFGTWEGRIEVGGESLAVKPSEVLGCRDRSWGVRPVGERESGAPGAPRQFFWLWAPLHFEDRCTLCAINEDEAGRPWHSSGVTVALLAAPDAPVGEDGIERMASVTHRVRWQPGTRRAASAELVLVPHAGASLEIALEPILTFQMLGLGYLHPDWGHGMWKGPSALGGESWKLDELAPMDPRHLHVQQLCRARLGKREGIGVLEQLVIGPHAPSGFREILDPAT